MNPYVDDPAEHFVFDFDMKTGLASVRGITVRGVTTETEIGLNRLDLRSHRSLFMKKLACIARLAATEPEAAAILAEAKLASSEYSAFANSL